MKFISTNADVKNYRIHSISFSYIKKRRARYTD